MNIERGGVYLAALDPASSRKKLKTRPVLVISNNTGNAYSGTATVLSITSESVKKIYPFEVGLKKGTANLPKDSKVKADQIQTLNQKRLVKSIGLLSEDIMAQVETAVKIHLEL